MTHEMHTPGPTPGMSRYQDEETGRVVTGWALHNHLVHDHWTVDRSRMDSTFGESPDVWAMVDQDGEARTYQRIADVPEDAEGDETGGDG